MSYRRYEVTLPTRHNDGTVVDDEPFVATFEDIVSRFDAITILPETVRGIWEHGGRRYDEYNVRFVLDVEDTEENAEFFRQLKQVLKTRFRQIDIWIVSYEIRIT